jgi:hypothetical protein
MSKQQLSPRQSSYLQAYSDPASTTFGNAYKSAVSAGYSHQTARNITHLMPEWLSDNIGKLTVMGPDELMNELTRIIQDVEEPTVIRLKAIEMSMRAYSMMNRRTDPASNVVNISVDLSI